LDSATKTDLPSQKIQSQAQRKHVVDSVLEHWLHRRVGGAGAVCAVPGGRPFDDERTMAVLDIFVTLFISPLVLLYIHYASTHENKSKSKSKSGISWTRAGLKKAGNIVCSFVIY
jgi:hypothetical protein